MKEEVAELIEAVEKNTNKIHESADVIYHILVYLEANDIKIEDVIEELEREKIMSYNRNNIFAKILRGEILKKIFENDYVLSFYDINPQKKFMRLLFQRRIY